ncbi:MAG: hypothetical protein BVN34_09060 [Proteobacteria bacterium ST_bin12]|nr:MAG: hypothetical protein BVN34_09060 [Proteobacteria bacterium ST_bin12]
MMFLKNDLIQYEGDKTIRILWIHPEQPYAFTIEIGDVHALPQSLSTNNLQADLSDGKAKLLKSDPFFRIVKDEALPPKHINIRDKAYSFIEELVANQPAIFVENKRWHLIVACIKKNKEKYKTTHKTIYLYLRRYWQRGQTKNALLPDYSKCGAKGETRTSNPDIKRGRPRKYSEEVGLNVSEDMRKIFKVAVSRFYATDSKFTLQGAFDEMIRKFFCNREVDNESGRIIHQPKDEVATSGFPTVGQFTYWLNQDHNRPDIKRKRVGNKAYDKDLRGLLGTSNAEVWGPGSRYQIDATIADVYLVSRIDRTKIIGRPVIYIVIDVFSRMIVGLYVGLEGPSWVGAMMALANTVTDKQAFCKRFNIKIEPHEWPCHHLPSTILGDKGEIEANIINTLMNNFNVIVENASAYRADWKGIVEQRFKLLPAMFKPYVPGYIEPDFRERGSKDYRLDAVLDLDQFTQIIIECALYYNNDHEFKHYDRDQDLASDNIPAVPVELWEWGIANRSGQLRIYPEELVKFSLLPAQLATVTMFGIKFGGVYYTCQRAMEELWFDRARQNNTWKVKVSYDPRDADEIYLHSEKSPRQFDVCHMIERSRAYQNVSSWEIEQQQFKQKKTSANHAPSQQLARSNLAGRVETIVASAIQQKPDTSHLSNSCQTNNIRENRALEKAENRKSEVFNLGKTSTESLNQAASNAKVIKFPTQPIDDYAEPDITDIVADNNKGNDDERP